MSSCLVPTVPEDIDGDDRWISIHKRFLQEIKEHDPDVLFLGDSILQALQNTEVWNELFVPLHSLNFSIHRDRVENVLWRVQNGELDNIKPKIVVLHVGTNNYNNKPEEIVEGILAIIKEIQNKLPDTNIVLPTILPRGEHINPMRDHIKTINELLKQNVISIPKVDFIVVDKDLVQIDGTISPYDMYDYLLLTNIGCKKVFEQVYDLLVQLLNDSGSKDLTPSE